MGGRWTDLERPPLDAIGLNRTLTGHGSLWTSIEVVEETGSTNSDLAARARAGAEEGSVLVAERQTAGRGRLDRRWTAPARSGLFFSVLLRPGGPATDGVIGASGVDGAHPPVPTERWGWLTLLAGVATASALSRAAGVDTLLKWPNDVLVRVDGAERKTGGILAERSGDAVVLGIGLNVTLREAELPVPEAGSLQLAGAISTDRETLLRAVLRSLERWYTDWRAAGGDPGASRLQEAYTAGCATLGRSVRAVLPGGGETIGEAVAVDGDGRLVIDSAGGRQAVSAGDIVHLRPASGP